MGDGSRVEIGGSSNYQAVDQESASAIKAKSGETLKDKMMRWLRIGTASTAITVGAGIGATSVVDHEDPIDVTKNIITNSQEVGGALKHKVGFSTESPTTASNTSPENPTTTVSK